MEFDEQSSKFKVRSSTTNTPVRTLTVQTPTHGRVLIDDPAADFSGRMIVGFHGYGQSADTMIDDLRRIPGAAACRLVSVQALHRFYARSEAVVASWMTRQDREHAIADNIGYVDQAVAEAAGNDVQSIVFLGFSQGASMAARAAVRGSRTAAGLVLLAGDIPPDVREVATKFPPVLIGCGVRDEWYAGDRVNSDRKFLESKQIPHEIVMFNGGHEFTDEFRTAAGAWIDRIFVR